jgi:hypothetical protein
MGLEKEKTMHNTNLTALSLRRSTLLRMAQSALFALGGVAALTAQAQAANVSSTSTMWLKTNTGSAPVADTDVHGYVGSNVEDPFGAHSTFAFRAWNGVDVNLTSGGSYSQVFVTQGTNSKTITTRANGSITKKAHAHGIDPFGFPAEARDRQVYLSLELENTMVSSYASEKAQLLHTRSIEIGRQKQPLYDLYIGVQNGGAPVVNLTVYPIAAAQGWNADALKNALCAALRPGPTAGSWVLSKKITFPALQFRLPAGQKFDLYTSDEADTGTPGFGMH